MKNSNHRPEVLVVLHDAGGAEIIGAYIKKHRTKTKFTVYGAGPSERIFKRLRIPLKKIANSRRAIAVTVKHHRSALYALLPAPGWMTHMETHALQEAKKVGLKTIVYIDSWEDERRRFGYPRAGWENLIPDVFWVGDRYALQRIRRVFPDTPSALAPNQYFARQVQYYRSLKRSNSHANAILFVSQDRPGSYELLAALLRVLAREKKPADVRIRYHPVDARTRYDSLIRSFGARVRIVKSTENDLVRDLLHARIVVGTETGAMAVAVLCKIPVISFVSKHEKPVLPFPHIVRLRTIGALHRALKGRVGRRS